MYLRCYDPNQYVYNIDAIDGQCIAPTSKGSRCNNAISIDELNEANLCRKHARGMKSGDARDWELERHVLARCCGECHREKLDQSTSSCLRTIAMTYSNTIADPNAWRSAAGRSKRAKPASQMQTDRYLLQPRLSGPNGTVYPSRAIQMIPLVNGVRFVSYRRRQNDDINTVLQRPAREEYTANDKLGAGFVYVLRWPRCPNYYKAGYTTNNAGDRAVDLSSCYEGLEVAFAGARFAWPKRFERLVHLQLGHFRRTIPQCEVCGSEHKEWFEISVEEIENVIKEWKRLDQREPLYDRNGDFSEAWRRRLEECTTDLTVDALHAIVDLEEVKANQALVAERAAETRALIDSLGKEVETLKMQIRAESSMPPESQVGKKPAVESEPDKSGVQTSSTSQGGAMVAAVAANQIVQTAQTIQAVVTVAVPQVAQVVIADAVVEPRVLVSTSQSVSTTTGQCVSKVHLPEAQSQADRSRNISTSTDRKPASNDKSDDGSDMLTFFGDFMTLLHNLTLDTRDKTPFVAENVGGRMLRSMIAV